MLLVVLLNISTLATLHTTLLAALGAVISLSVYLFLKRHIIRVTHQWKKKVSAVGIKTQLKNFF
jgi:hypothetical protein